MASYADLFDPLPLLERLADAQVDFVVIGGVAGGAHGSSYPTYDLDIAYARDRPNIEKLVELLRDLRATLRGVPSGVPFELDAKTIENGSHFTFSTEHGSFDLRSDPAGTPPYAALKAAAIEGECAAKLFCLPRSTI